MTIRITDVTPRSCRLDGWPTVTFLGVEQRALATTVSHNGPGGFFASRRAIVLTPGTDSTAGFVVTSKDFPAGNQRCQKVSGLRVVLPGVADSFDGPGLKMFAGYHLCNVGDPVDISSITAESVIDRYAPMYPRCLAQQLSLSLGQGGVASGSVTQSGILTNKSTAVCTLEGYPDLSLVGAAGQMVVKFRAGTATYTLYDPAIPRPVTLEPGISAKFEFSASDSNATTTSGNGGLCPRSDELRVVLSSGVIDLHSAFRICGLAGVGAFTQPA